jgi:hypothetical protein
MMSLDVAAEIEIAAAPADVAGVMFDPAREPEWVQVVKQVSLLDPALVAGARVRRQGSVLGRDIEWTTEVERVHFPHLLILRIVDGPALGSLRYDIQRSAGGSRVSVRGATETSANSIPFPASLLKSPLEAILAADLARLKTIVETPG